MIPRAQMQERVREWGLAEQVVEKDYAIGWVLWGIGNDPVLQPGWAFKGGTCLKKCYLETYRFSEDLDFTVLPGGPIEAGEVRAALERVLGRVEKECGLDLTSVPLVVKERRHGLEVRIYYRGPSQTRVHSKIKFDLTAREKVVRPTVLRPIGHSYPDHLPDPDKVRCYSFEEVFAEKLRALGERCRPRDLYDVVNLFRRQDLAGEAGLIRQVLEEKCASKGVPLPTLQRLEEAPYRTEVETEWANMLAHQLPALPDFGPFWEELEHLFEWLEGRWQPPELLSAELGGSLDYEWIPPPTVYVWGAGVPLEPVRFAGANRLCVELGYQGTIRLVEPYSLRRTREGQLLFYAVKTRTGELRSYRVDRIQSVEVSPQTFRARFRVEFSDTRGLVAPPKVSTTSPRLSGSRSGSADRYVVECRACGRQFRRKTRSTTLRPHNDSRGRPCRGRSGRLK